MPNLRLLLAAPLAVLAVGCSVQTPTASVHGVSLGAVDSAGLTLNLAVGVTNPNTFAIPLASADYAVTLAGTKTITGTFTPSGSLVAGQETSVTVPIGIRWDDLLATKAALVKSGGNFPFALNASMSPSGALAVLGDRAKVKLNYNGTLPLKDALNHPEAIMNSPAARELALALLSRLPF